MKSKKQPPREDAKSATARGRTGNAEQAGGLLSREVVAVDAPHRWTFLTNHAHVLIVLHASPGIVLREVAQRVGITERAVQRIIHDLEQAQVISRKKVGRQNQYEVLTEQPLRHPIEAHRSIGDLLKLISG